jgi:signal transduction histidine kinase
VRRRILLAIIGVAAVAVLVFAIPLGLTVRSLTVKDELSEVERSAERVGRAVEPEDVVGTSAVAQRIARREFPTAVYDSHGTRVSGRGPARLDAGLRRALDGDVVTDNGSPLRVAVPIGVNPTTGVVRATASTANVDTRVRDAWLVLAGFAALAIGAAAALAWWVSRRLDAPLVRLAEAAHRVGDGDFTTRAPRSGVAEIDGVAQAIDTTAERLGAALERERAFSANVSHQLRTRVAGLRITLEAGVLAPGHEAAALGRAIEETTRLEETVVEFLTLSREAGGPRLPFSVTGALDELATTWQPRFEAVGRRLDVDTDPDTPWPTGSAVAVREILDVLVDNAFRHGRGNARVTSRQAQGRVAIDVGDEGPGIPTGVDPFARRSPRPDGHGIGLALARSLAEAERWRLVLTRRTPGALFTLLLPVDDREAVTASDGGGPPP